MPAPRVIIFDVDGTLVDSQTEILDAMTGAYATEGLAPPNLADVRSIVGLSLPEAMARLRPDDDPARHIRLVTAYKSGFNRHGQADSPARSPLFPGARVVLDHLRAAPETLLAVATGKSRRGLVRMLARHGLHAHFVSQQTSDTHPSKPHPSMIKAVLDETGIPAHRAVMIGDTSFDIDMGRAAGVGTIAVTWGYHRAADLRADAMIDHFDALPAALTQLLGATA